MKLSAPKIDLAIQLLKSFMESGSKLNPGSIDLITQINEKIQPIKPIIDSKDVIRKIWIKAERGEISEFGDFREYMDEDMVSSYDDFIELWQCSYPENFKWYELGFIEYDNNLYFSIDSDVQISMNEVIISEKPNDQEEYADMIFELLTWILFEVELEMGKLIDNPGTYNDYLDKNLFRQKRFGKISRMILWQAFDDSIRFDKKLGNQKIHLLRKIVPKIKDEPVTGLEKLTANDFYNFCEYCYEANDYFSTNKENLTSKDKYYHMADGRDEGMREINENSSEEFDNWYFNRQRGGHPWEICRGGNSTHISLFVQNKENKWFLILAGSSSIRVVETVNAALALYKHKIPFVLDQAEEILRMVTGDDFYGIVPEHIMPRYCGGLFPSEDKIIDFLNPWSDPELSNFIIKNAAWYPLDQWELV